MSRRDVYNTLSPLKKHLVKREKDGADATALGKKLAAKWKTKSPKGRDLAYWAENTYWQVSGPVEGLVAQNKQALLRMSDEHGANPTHGHISEIYSDLLAWTDKAAVASRITACDEKIISREAAMAWWGEHLSNTEAAARRTSKPYRIRKDDFFAELHHVSEHEVQRALTGYDARYELKRWRSEELAEYLADWVPEVALKASELVEVQHLNLREKMRSAFREIERHREVDPERLLAEVLLHAVLRHRFQSEPIACKLFYQTAHGTKTFGNAHIVHGTPDRLWLGRATLATAATYNAVLDVIVGELSHVLDPDFLKEEREVILTLREPQHLLRTTLENALMRHTPVDDLLEVLSIPILIAYDSEVLSGGFSEDYRAKLIDEVAACYAAIKPVLPPALETLHVHIFMVPIECVSTLARRFGRTIGGS